MLKVICKVDMVISCAAFGCVNRWKLKRDLAAGERNLAFHRFPLENEDLLNKWIQAMRRDEWFPSKNARICENHFLPSDYNYPPEIIKQLICRKHLKRDAVPSVFNFPDIINSTESPLPTEGCPEASTACSTVAKGTESVDSTPPINSQTTDQISTLSFQTTHQATVPLDPASCPTSCTTTESLDSTSFPTMANNPKPVNASKKSTARLDHSYANEKSPLELCAQYRKRIIEKDSKLRNLRKSKIRLEKNVRGLVAKLKAARLLNKTLSTALRQNFAYMTPGIIGNGSRSPAIPIAFRSASEYNEFALAVAHGWPGTQVYKGNVFQQVEANAPVSKTTNGRQMPL